MVIQAERAPEEAEVALNIVCPVQLDNKDVARLCVQSKRSLLASGYPSSQQLCLVQLDTQEAVTSYNQSKRKLLVLGYNATLTTAVEAPRQPKRHFDQIKVLSRLQTASVSASVISPQAAKPARPLRGPSAGLALLPACLPASE